MIILIGGSSNKFYKMENIYVACYHFGDVDQSRRRLYCIALSKIHDERDDFPYFEENDKINMERISCVYILYIYIYIYIYILIII